LVNPTSFALVAFAFNSATRSKDLGSLEWLIVSYTISLPENMAKTKTDLEMPKPKRINYFLTDAFTVAKILAPSNQSGLTQLAS
jgi:hypothetical protein